MTKLLGAVKYMHDRDIVHKDIKPFNILLTDDTAEIDYKIIDFGYAEIMGSRKLTHV